MIINEVWRPILEVKGTHEVSNYGRVRNSTTLQPIKINIRPTGYCYVTIGSRSDNTRRCVSLHRLVAKYFCIGFNENLVVNHIDGDKGNNKASNLEWVTQKENVLHAHKLGLINTSPYRHTKSVRCVDTGEIFNSTHEASNATGISQGLISLVCNGKRNVARGLKWEFVDHFN